MNRPERDDIAAVLAGISTDDRRDLDLLVTGPAARALADRLMQHYDVQIRKPESPQVCDKCHNFVDTPGHIHGCAGLAEAGIPPYAGHKLPL